MNSPRPFDGKVLLLGIDFRHTALVIPRGFNAAVIESSIKQSPLWHFVTKLSLTENMRITGQDDFNKWLLAVGNGTLSNNEGLEENLIEIPQNMVSTNNIIREVLGKELLLDNDEAVERVSSTIILTPKNKDYLHINTDIMSLLPGEATICRNVDTIVEVEFLNSLTLSGMPPHILTLKRHSIVMLLRTLNLMTGLLNRIRILVLSIKDLFIHGKILSGSKKGGLYSAHQPASQ
ncbi:uncharacterized protein LOC106868574 [Octopus bimaculoides]|nr:uncharacterized protein LOC106868574 [Octopus bimaculoides]|eukprot:XP_014769381.1 PREDICTED: uncharacterized protein LOC106868574 [Octopus bimaculoides]